MLDRIRHDVFNLGADPCTPIGPGAHAAQRLCSLLVQPGRLEAELAAVNADLPVLTSFALPGGSAASAWVYHTRWRAAERAMVPVAAAETLTPGALRCLNRLSDHLFVLRCWLNGHSASEVLWRPGTNR
jgi:cob(I)alamin adenosyltransferase